MQWSVFVLIQGVNRSTSLQKNFCTLQLTIATCKMQGPSSLSILFIFVCSTI